MSDRFRSDCEKFHLAFTCEACRHFCPERQACAVLYPCDPHRDATIRNTADDERVYFCKMFEAE